MSHTRFRGCFVYYEFYIDVFFVVNLVMDFLLLRLVNRVLKGTATPLLYGFSFLTGGILTALPGGTKEGLLTFCFITTATYWILILGMRLLEYLKGKSSAICEVIIRAGGKSVKVKGLYDTGNRLRDTLTRKPLWNTGGLRSFLARTKRLLLRDF